MQIRLLSTHNLLSTIGIAALTLSAVNAAPPETRAETTTYVDGNLAGVSPNTGGTLLFSEEKTMYLRTGLSTVTVPYANISHVELGATKETSHDVPLYKVWALHKRFSGKTETQLLVVEFKSDEGESKNMTLELAKGSASGVLSLIQSRTAGNAAAEKTLVAAAEPSSKSPEGEKATSSEPSSSPDTAAEIQEAVSKSDSSVAAKKDSKNDTAKTFAPRPDKPVQSWWGDDYWRTARNADKWSAKAPTSPANNEHQR